jgi:uncharacterized protein YodC (DUF2158 family)
MTSEARTAVSETFCAGDKAWLRSGGPCMTVLDVGRDTGQVWCRWMSEAGTVIEQAFPIQTIQSKPVWLKP